MHAPHVTEEAVLFEGSFVAIWMNMHPAQRTDVRRLFDASFLTGFLPHPPSFQVAFSALKFWPLKVSGPFTARRCLFVAVLQLELSLDWGVDDSFAFSLCNQLFLPLLFGAEVVVDELESKGLGIVPNSASVDEVAAGSAVKCCKVRVSCMH